MCVHVCVCMCVHVCVYRASRSTDAGPGDAVAARTVCTVAWLLAAMAVVTRRAGLVAVKPRPPSRAQTLTRQRMTAGGEEERKEERREKRRGWNTNSTDRKLLQTVKCYATLVLVYSVLMFCHYSASGL